MERECFGQCLPSFLGKGGNGAHRTDGWYETEIARMKAEVAKLRDTNKSLNRDLAAQERVEEEEEEEEADSDVVDPADIKPEVDQDIDEDLDVDDGDAEGGLGDIVRDASNPAMGAKDSSPTSALQEVKAWASGNVNSMVMKSSALGQTKPVQVTIYAIAAAGVCFVLLAHAFHLGVVEEAGHSSAASGDAGAVDEQGAHHRRLGGGASPMLINIAFCMTGCGLTAFLINMIQGPLILGYLLGGILVGPMILHLVEDYHAIDDISSLGLVFCLFMIGLELDVKQLLNMDRITIFTGFFQFPICAALLVGVFEALHMAGLFGTGEYTSVYLGTACALSSTMIVVKLLQTKRDMNRPNGVLTIGILIFQDIWAIIVLALQPNVDDHEGLDFLKTIGLSVLLCVVSLCYAKFVMPAVLLYSSKSVELMLVLSLAWCFFVCCLAILPFVNLSMELAALVAGLALATFPYSTEFNGKIKYIRDFFLTLFFAGLGMIIPLPDIKTLATAVLMAVIIILSRWLTVFLLVVLQCGGGRLGALASINLSQLSEFTLVICILGLKAGHIDEETMTCVIWTFGILAACSTLFIFYNHRIFRFVNHQAKKSFGTRIPQLANPEVDDGDIRDIVFLGFHRITFMLMNEFRNRNRGTLSRIHVIDFNSKVMPMLRKQGIKCTYGDYSMASTLESVQGPPPSIVLSSIPDSLLQGMTNEKITKTAKSVWPAAKIISTAENPQQAASLYKAEADYALRSAKLCAERLHELLTLHSASGSELSNLFQQYKRKDKDRTRASFFIGKTGL